MEKRSFFAILPDSLFEEFDIHLKQLEEVHQVVRKSNFKEKGNKFNMPGNTFHLSYEKGGKYKAFLKEVRILWAQFNTKYPKTSWKGK
jgi:hypothetical protein